MRDEFIPLFQAIRQKTALRDANWAATGVGDQYRLELRSGTLLFDMYLADEALDHFLFTLLTPKGAKAAEIGVYQGDLWWNEVCELFRLVEWQSNKAGETLDSMLQELNANKVVGKTGEDDIPF